MKRETDRIGDISRDDITFRLEEGRVLMEGRSGKDRDSEGNEALPFLSFFFLRAKKKNTPFRRKVAHS